MINNNIVAHLHLPDLDRGHKLAVVSHRLWAELEDT